MSRTGISRFIPRVLMCVVFALSLASRIEAQWLPTEGSSYSLHECLADLKAGGVDLPRSAVLAAYEQYFAEIMQLRRETQSDRAKMVAKGNSSYPSKQEVSDALELFRKSSKRTEESEARLFAALQAQAPDSTKAAIAAVQAVRKSRCLIDAIEHMPLVHTGNCAKLDMQAESVAPDAATKAAVRAALARTASERNQATQEMFDAQIRAMQAAGTAAEAEGIAGVDLRAAWEEAWSHEEEPKSADEAAAPPTPPAEVVELSRRLELIRAKGMAPVWKPSLAVQRVQWKAALDVAAVLPAPRARRFMCDVVSELMPEMPMWFSPDDDLRAIMAWKKAPTGCEATIRTAAAEWIHADDVAVRAGATKLLSLLATMDRSPENDRGADSAVKMEAAASEVFAQRSKAWADFVKAIGPCCPPMLRGGETSNAEPPIVESVDPEDEFDEELGKAAYELSGYDTPEAEDDLPAPDELPDFDESASGLPSEKSLAKLLKDLGVPEEQLPLAEQIRADAVERWSTEVSPRWGDARDYSRHWVDKNGAPRGQQDAEASATEAFQSAFSVMTAAQNALADSLVAALGKTMQPSIETPLRIALRVRDPGGWNSMNWRTESEWQGGLRINPGEVLASAQLSAADRAAAAAVLASAAPALDAALQSARTAAVVYTVEVSTMRMDRDEEGTRAQKRKRYKETGERIYQAEWALAKAVDAARTAAEGVVERMCAAVTPDAASRLRETATRCAFRGLYRDEDQVERVVQELSALVPSSDPALAKLKSARDKYRAAATPVREQFIRSSKAMRGRALPADRHDTSPETALRQVQDGDMWFEQANALAVFIVRLQDALPADVVRKSPALRRLSGRHEIDLR